MASWPFSWATIATVTPVSFHSPTTRNNWPLSAGFVNVAPTSSDSVTVHPAAARFIAAISFPASMTCAWYSRKEVRHERVPSSQRIGCHEWRHRGNCRTAWPFLRFGLCSTVCRWTSIVKVPNCCTAMAVMVAPSLFSPQDTFLSPMPESQAWKNYCGSGPMVCWENPIVCSQSLPICVSR